MDPPEAARIPDGFVALPIKRITKLILVYDTYGPQLTNEAAVELVFRYFDAANPTVANYINEHVPEFGGPQQPIDWCVWIKDNPRRDVAGFDEVVRQHREDSFIVHVLCARTKESDYHIAIYTIFTTPQGEKPRRIIVTEPGYVVPV